MDDRAIGTIWGSIDGFRLSHWSANQGRTQIARLVERGSLGRERERGAILLSLSRPLV